MSAVADSRPPGQFYCPTCEQSFQSGELCPTDGTRLVRLQGLVDPLIGRELDGRYTILEKLGQGGMGAVYRGSQHSVSREVAIKLISAHLVSEPDVIKRFLREAKLASRLSHPNAVSVLDFGQDSDGLFYLVMELVAGHTLDLVMKAERVLRPERIVRMATQVCDALEGAHALQIVHRDLKPANIMLLAQGRDIIKVLDFGLAKSSAPDQTSTTMTNAGALLGTPAYMPPELALGQPCDGRADLYALGCILFQMGSGRLPFMSDSAHELIAMHATDRAPPMAGVPQPLAAVIDKLLEKRPERRFQSAAETREALEAALDGRLVTPVSGVNIQALDSQRNLPQAANSARMPLATQLGAAPIPRTPVPGRVSGNVRPSDFAHIATASSSEVHRSPRRGAWLIPLVLLGAIGAGVGAFVVVTNHNATVREDAMIAPQTTSAVEAPADAAVALIADAAPAVEVVEPRVVQNTVTVDKRVPTKKPPTKKPPVKVEKKPDKPPVTNAGSGSGAKSGPALPF